MVMQRESSETVARTGGFNGGETTRLKEGKFIFLLFSQSGPGF